MKLRDLLEQLSNLPLHHRDLDVLEDRGPDEILPEMRLEPIKENNEVVGYLIVGVSNIRLKLPFEEK
jgi:hypothetical protein